MATTHLPPEYGLSLIRLTGDADAWPGLLLHSRQLTWAFDPDRQSLLDVAAVRTLAGKAGLHQVGDPFGADLHDGTGTWSFRLPTLARAAQLTGPGLAVDITRTPHVTDDWWRMAVTHGSCCRLLVAACVAFPDDPADGAVVLNEAARAGRLYGATIRVDF